MDQLVEEMLGTSPAIHAIFGLIHKMAKTDLPVLVTGEAGTGKEVTARAIHARSPWEQGPFVPINCGAIPETLLESELFGHERGAFTGAVHQKKGKLKRRWAGPRFWMKSAISCLSYRSNCSGFYSRGRSSGSGGTRPSVSTLVSLPRPMWT